MATRVRFLRGTALGGIGNDAAPGQIVTLPDDQAGAFIRAGRAVPCEGAAPVPEHRESAPPVVRRGHGRKTVGE